MGKSKHPCLLSKILCKYLIGMVDIYLYGCSLSPFIGTKESLLFKKGATIEFKVDSIWIIEGEFRVDSIWIREGAIKIGNTVLCMTTISSY